MTPLELAEHILAFDGGDPKPLLAGMPSLAHQLQQLARAVRDLTAERDANYQGMCTQHERTKFWMAEWKRLEAKLDKARAAAVVLAARVDDLGGAADDNDPACMACAEPIGEAEANLWVALDIDPKLHPSAALKRGAAS